MLVWRLFLCKVEKFASYERFVANCPNYRPCLRPAGNNRPWCLVVSTVFSQMRARNLWRTIVDNSSQQCNNVEWSVVVNSCRKVAKLQCGVGLSSKKDFDHLEGEVNEGSNFHLGSDAVDGLRFALQFQNGTVPLIRRPRNLEDVYLDAKLLSQYKDFGSRVTSSCYRSLWVAGRILGHFVVWSCQPEPTRISACCGRVWQLQSVLLEVMSSATFIQIGAILAILLCCHIFPYLFPFLVGNC